VVIGGMSVGLAGSRCILFRCQVMCEESSLCKQIDCLAYSSMVIYMVVTSDHIYKNRKPSMISFKYEHPTSQPSP
jgi:hypothetical protein